MLQKTVLILGLGFVVYLGLKGHLDVPVEKVRTSLWVSANMASAGTEGGTFREWLEERGFRTYDVDERVVIANVGAPKVRQTRGAQYWTCTVSKTRPLGEMDLVLYVAENPNGRYLEYWTRSTVSDRE